LPPLPPVDRLSDSKHPASAPAPKVQLPSIATTLQEALEQISRTHDGYRKGYTNDQQE
jgi:hypothetical protein